MIDRRGFLVREKILAALRRESKIGRRMSVREIGEAVGLRSSSTVHSHLQQLRRQGKIKVVRFQSRSIEIVREPEEICPCCEGSGWTNGPTATFLQENVLQ